MIYIITLNNKMKLEYYSRKSKTVSLINIDTGMSQIYNIKEITDKESDIVKSLGQQLSNSDLLIIGFDNNLIVALIILKEINNDVCINYFHCDNYYVSEFMTRTIKFITNMGYYNVLVLNNIIANKDILINSKFIENEQYMIRSCNIKGPSSRL